MEWAFSRAVIFAGHIRKCPVDRITDRSVMHLSRPSHPSRSRAATHALLATTREVTHNQRPCFYQNNPQAAVSLARSLKQRCSSASRCVLSRSGGQRSTTKQRSSRPPVGRRQWSHRSATSSQSLSVRHGNSKRLHKASLHYASDEVSRSDCNDGLCLELTNTLRTFVEQPTQPNAWTGSTHLMPTFPLAARHTSAPSRAQPNGSGPWPVNRQGFGLCAIGARPCSGDPNNTITKNKKLFLLFQCHLSVRVPWAGVTSQDPSREAGHHPHSKPRRAPRPGPNVPARRTGTAPASTPEEGWSQEIEALVGCLCLETCV